jgi:hypothetical protein
MQVDIMSIQYEAKKDGDILRIRAWGRDESLKDVIIYGSNVLSECLKHDVTRVISDERELEYRIDTVEIYELAKIYAELDGIIEKVAFVCSPEFLADARFMENAAKNRGLIYRAFDNYNAADRWIKE